MQIGSFFLQGVLFVRTIVPVLPFGVHAFDLQVVAFVFKGFMLFQQLAPLFPHILTFRQLVIRVVGRLRRSGRRGRLSRGRRRQRQSGGEQEKKTGTAHSELHGLLSEYTGSIAVDPG